MQQHHTPAPVLLSTLWVFVLLNIIFRDLHQFLNTSALTEMMSLNFSETDALLFAFIVEIPIAMVVLSRVLSDRINKWVNLTATLICLLGALSTLPKADLDDIFFVVVESIAFVAIASIAWKLPQDSVNQSLQSV